MAAVPITFQCMVYPRDKSGAPYPATLVGFASITGLHPDGGPILPPDEIPPVEPPLKPWPPEDAHPEHPIVLPDPITPPITPPDVAQPPHEGWNWKPSTPDSPEAGWYFLYVPSHHEDAPSPKTERAKK